MNKHTVMITGAAGYVGAMLMYRFAMRDDVARIYAIDKDKETDLTLNIENSEHKDKIIFLQASLANDNWILLADQLKPDIIVHAAWQIREIYGRRDVSWLYNIVSSDKVFDYALSRAHVRRLIHFSTVASYGALSSNSLSYKFTEEDILRQTVYLYAEEKRIVEEHLMQKYQTFVSSNGDINSKQIMIIRPASITGPRLRNEINKFSLQSALSGSLKRQKGFLNKLIGTMTSFMPATRGWLRQYIHEDDVVAIVSTLAFDKHDDRYEVYNICPPGPVVYAPDMARALGKRVIMIHPRLIQAVFAFFWHITRGRVPTAPGVWMGYSYPIGVDGSRITHKHNYNYKYESLEALTTTKGDFAKR